MLRTIGFIPPVMCGRSLIHHLFYGVFFFFFENEIPFYLLFCSLHCWWHQIWEN